MGDFTHCATCGAPSNGSYRCAACTASVERAAVGDAFHLAPTTRTVFPQPVYGGAVAGLVSAIVLATPHTRLERWLRRCALGVLLVPVAIVVVLVTRQLYFQGSPTTPGTTELARIRQLAARYGTVSDLDCEPARRGAAENWYCTATIGGTRTDLSVVDERDGTTSVRIPAPPVR